MTYDEIIRMKYAHVAFVLSDRVIIIKITSVKREDLNGTIFSHISAGKVPFFKVPSADEKINI